MKKLVSIILSLFLFNASLYAGIRPSLAPDLDQVGSGGGGGITSVDSSTVGTELMLYLTDSYVGLASTVGDIKYLGMNMTFVEVGTDNLQTSITAANPGDVLVLGAGTYQSTTTVTIDKSLTLFCPAGPYMTVLNMNSGSGTVSLLSITHSNVNIINCGGVQTSSGSTTYGFRAVGTAGTVLTDVNIINPRILHGFSILLGSYTTGIHFPISYEDAGGTIINPLIDCASSDNLCGPIRMTTASTTEAATTLNVYGGSVTSQCTSGNCPSMYSSESSSTQDGTLNIYGTAMRTTELGASTSYGAWSNGGANAIVNIYSSPYISATDNDLGSTSSGVLNVYSANLANNTTTGTINYLGNQKFGSVQLGATLTSSRTTDFGWSIVAGANTACNTTCTSACVMGTDAVTGQFLACTDATADSCLCAGAS